MPKIDSPQGLEGRLLDLKEALRRAGVKTTPQRLEIFREVADSIDHPDVVAVFNGVRRRMPTVALDTVYRALWLYRDLGLIRTLAPFHDRARFDANLAPHHHFICTRCGKIRDFMSEELHALAIPEAVRAFGLMESTHVEVRGRCRECAQRTAVAPASNRKQSSRKAKGDRR